MISVQNLNARRLKLLAPAIATLARAEGLEAHARSVETRLAQARKTGQPHIYLENPNTWEIRRCIWFKSKARRFKINTSTLNMLSR